jgi:hypothetical protein
MDRDNRSLLFGQEEYIMSIRMRFLHLKKEWKLFCHLLFHTKHFGVNNKWWSEFPSIFGWPWWHIVFAILTIRPLIDSYQMIKFRAQACKFVSAETLKELGWDEQ